MNAAPKTQTRKRRSRASDSPDGSGDDGKKRGRPRVEKQDESAADRRRTQIRMAQRAYRQRKESTLDELRRRVSDLTNTIEMMNKSFVDCRDRLLHSGISEAQNEDLRGTALQFEALMKCTRNPDDDNEMMVTQTMHRGSTTDSPMKDIQSQGSIEAKNVPTWMDRSAINSAPKGRDSQQVGMGYVMYSEHSGTENTVNELEYLDDYDLSSQILVPTSQKSPRSNIFEVFRAQVPAGPPSIPASLSPPITYSFQESTFARRLHRACLEQAYQLLLDPERRPASYDRVFKLSLLTKSHAKLTKGIGQVLKGGPQDPLHSVMPLIHIGGAGTHYAKRDQFGNFLPKKESFNLGVIGHQTLALLENAAGQNLTTDMTVDIAGFEGEWFDPYDVEGYLLEKGITIDPSSSFAEAEVIVWSPEANNTGGSMSTVTSASPQTPQGPLSDTDLSRMFDSEQLQNLSRMQATPDEWNNVNLMDLSDVGFSDADTGSWMNFLQPGQNMRQASRAEQQLQELGITWEGSRTNEFLQDVSEERVQVSFQRPGQATTLQSQQQKKVIIIDVAKFVKVMIVSGVCIGRTPGFKRKDVDRALALASFDAL